MFWLKNRAKIALTILAVFLLAGGCPMTGDDMGMPESGDLIVNGTVFADAFSSNSPLLLQTAGMTRIFVDDEDGHVGIGTSSPQSTLHVSGGNIMCDDDVRIQMRSPLHDDAITTITDSGISSHTGAAFAFSTSQTPGGDAIVHLRLTNDGRLGLGVFNPDFRLDLPNIATDAGGRGRANSWETYSSQRYKQDVRPIDHALDMVERLEGVRFTWKPEHGGTRDVGLIAERVAEVLPEIVSMDGEGQAAGLDYSRLVPVLIEALREVRAEKDRQLARRDAMIDAVKAENNAVIDSLMDENRAMRARLDRLEAALSVK